MRAARIMTGRSIRQISNITVWYGDGVNDTQWHNKQNNLQVSEEDSRKLEEMEQGGFQGFQDYLEIEEEDVDVDVNVPESTLQDAQLKAWIIQDQKNKNDKCMIISLRINVNQQKDTPYNEVI